MIRAPLFVLRIWLETPTPTKAEALAALKDLDEQTVGLQPAQLGPSETFGLRVFVRAVSDLAVWTARRAYTGTEYENYLTWIVGQRGIEDVMPWSRRFMAEIINPYDKPGTFLPANELVAELADRFVAGDSDEAEWTELADVFVLIAAGKEIRDLERERRAKLTAVRERIALRESASSGTETDIDAKLKAITEAARNKGQA